MWIRFWCNSDNNPSLNIDDDKFIWVSNRETDDSLKEWAQELIPTWAHYSVYYFGYERLTQLPDVVKLRLTRKCEEDIQNAKALLQILEEDS